MCCCGLGWFIEPYRGHHMVHHGGNINGFTALVSFFPHDDIGVVILTNKNVTPLSRLLSLDLYDRPLGLDAIDWSGRMSGEPQQEQSGSEAQEKSGKEGSPPSKDIEVRTPLFR